MLDVRTSLIATIEYRPSIHGGEPSVGFHRRFSVILGGDDVSSWRTAPVSHSVGATRDGSRWLAEWIATCLGGALIGSAPQIVAAVLAKEFIVIDAKLRSFPFVYRPLAAALAALSLACLAGCSSDAADSTQVESEPSPLSPANDTVIPFSEGTPASVFFAADAGVLYVADNENNQIWSWSEAAGLSKQATTLDPGGQLADGAAGVGQLIQLSDGTLLIARTGRSRGAFGALAWVRSDGSTGLVPGVDDRIRRLGVAQAPDGAIYGTRFEQVADGPLGAVTRIDLEQGETVLSEGFGKLVGVVVIGDQLFVSDQSQGVIYSAPLAALPAQAADWTRFVELAAPDQLAGGPDGSLFTGQFSPAADSTDTVAIRQVHADGSVTRFIADPYVAKPSGVAYDPVQRRLFVADAGNIMRYGVLVFPVPR